MPVHILLVRHAEPENPDLIIYGRLAGFPLSRAGHLQAEALGRDLSTYEVGHIYTSPLLRARQTARAIARHQPRTVMHVARGLLEVCNSYEGLPAAAVPRTFNYYEPRKSAQDETIEQIFRRMDRVLRRVVRAHAEETVICVGHGDPIAAVRAGYRGRDLTLRHLRDDDYPLKASVTSLVFEGAEAMPVMAYLRVGER